VINSSKATQVKRRGQSTIKKFEELRNEIDHLIKATDGVASELADAQDNTFLDNYPGLNFTSIRNALCKLNKHKSQDWIPSVLATCGSGPWDEQEFDEFLLGRDIQLYKMPNEGVKGLVLGISGWSEDDLSEQIYNRAPSSLRIYTQELFVLGLIAGRDPYEFLEQTAIDEVGLNHPAIQFILNQDFLWPWSVQPEEHEHPEEWKFDDGDWANESVLRQLGYSASARGPDNAERHRILRSAFESDNLPGIDSTEQRQRWGARKSPHRLHAISHFIGWLINLQGSEKPGAREKWVSDLMWLKQEFYAKAMRFTWPAVEATPIATTIAKTITKTILRPEAAWPFTTEQSSQNRSADSVGKSSNPKPRNFFAPRHELAIIIGQKPRPSLEIAVEDLRSYLKKNELINVYSGRVTSDSLLFALTGRTFLKESDLPDLVAKHMVSCPKPA
jgi:hypothetical protein